MRERITYILIVLLFVMTGTFCRPQAVAQVVVGSGEATLVQRTSSQDHDVSRYSGHSFLAPDIMSELHGSVFGQKALVKNFVLSSANNTEQQIITDSCCTLFTNLHPDPVAYYIFSLGRIRI